MIKIREQDGSFITLEQEELSNEQLLKLKNRMNEEISSIKIKLEEHYQLPEDEQKKQWVENCQKAIRYRSLNLQKIENERSVRNLKMKKNDISKVFMGIAKKRLSEDRFNILLTEAQAEFSSREDVPGEESFNNKIHL